MSKTPILLSFLVLLSFTGLAQGAPKENCILDPSTVTVGQDYYTVTSTGATPGALYEILFRQSGIKRVDEGTTVDRQIADETGTVKQTFFAEDARLYPLYPEGNFTAIVEPGTVKITVQNYRTGGGPGGGKSYSRTCTLTVLEA